MEIGPYVKVLIVTESFRDEICTNLLSQDHPETNSLKKNVSRDVAPNTRFWYVKIPSQVFIQHIFEPGMQMILSHLERYPLLQIGCQIHHRRPGKVCSDLLRYSAFLSHQIFM